MKAFKFAFLMILSLIALYRAQKFFSGTTRGNDFHYYPEDNVIPKDFWGFPNLTLRRAFYPCYDDASSENCPNLLDSRNGMIVFPSKFLDATFTGYAKGTEYKYYGNDCPIATASDVIDVQTYSSQYIRHSYDAMTPSGSQFPIGLVINFGPALDFTMQDEVIVYMWLFNPSATNQPRSVNACRTNQSSSCNKISDFSEVIDHDSYPARTLREEKITFLRNPALGNVVVTFNDKTESHTLPYVNTGDDLFLNYAFLEETNMRMNLMLVYNRNRFDVDALCATNLDCSAGYVCSNLRCQTQQESFCREKVNNGVECKFCSIISKNWWKIDPTDCNMVDHVNMNVFSDISMNFNTLVSNSYTVGFWLFVNNIAGMGDDVVNFIFNNHSMLSVGYFAGEGLVTFLNPWIRYTPDYTDITSTATLISIRDTKAAPQLIGTKYAQPNNKWIYIRYATTYDGLVYSFISYSGNITSSSNSTAPKGYDIDGSQITYPFKYFFGDKMTYRITNLGTLYGNTDFFVRSLALLGDYLPVNSLFHYYDLNTVDKSLFPSLYFHFDPIYDATKKELFFKDFAVSELKKITEQISLDHGVFSLNYNNYNWIIPYQFYRLTLAPFNKYFINGDLLTDKTNSFNCIGQMCGSVSYPVSCKSTQVMDISTGQCNDDCPNNYITNYGQHGQNQDSKYCSYPSNDENTANSDKNGVLYASDKISTLECDSSDVNYNNNYFQSFKRCISNSKSDDGALHYSGFFGTPDEIKIEIRAYTLKNYYVDFFMYVDKAYSSSGAFFLWLTESVSMKCEHNLIQDCSFIIGSSDTEYKNNNEKLVVKFVPSNWYHITYNVNYDSVTGLSTLTVYNNRAYLNNQNQYMTSAVTGQTKFYNIIFMHNQSFLGNTINWGSAYYRNIKVWNNNDSSMPLNVFNQLDRYWNFLGHSVARFDNLMNFYPLNLQTISSKTIQDIDFTDASINKYANTYRCDMYKYDQLQDVLSTTKEVFQRWNYQSDFDKFSGKATKSLTPPSSDDSLFYTISYELCQSGCLKCNFFYDSVGKNTGLGNCLLCAEKYYLENGNCLNKTNAYYYFMSPSYVNEMSSNQNTAQDSTFDIDVNSDKAITVSFFVKLLGWSTTPYLTKPTSGAPAASFDLFRYGRLVLRYYFATSNLCLEDNVGTPNYVIKTLCYNNFISRLGYWTHISLSYYSYSHHSTYYPNMFNLQINNKNILPNIAQLLTFGVRELMPISIPAQVIAVWAKLRHINKYINGAYSEVTNNNGLFKGDFFKLFETVNTNSNGTNCWDNKNAYDSLKLFTNNTYDITDYNLRTQCVLDYDPIIDTTEWCDEYGFFSYTNNTWNCIGENDDECRYGFYQDFSSGVDYCSCTSDHSIRDQYIVHYSTASDGNNKCVTHDYIDFGQYENLNITVKQPTREYTLEFWVHVNRYKKNDWDRIFSFKWQSQLKVNVYYTGSGYEASCKPIYANDTVYDFPLNLTQVLTLDKWAYVKCAVSRTVWAAFLTTDGINGSDKTEVDISKYSNNTNMPIVYPDNGTYPSSTSFTFENRHLNNGVIYFRQLRLWSCYKCQSPSLHYVMLDSTTAKYYDALLHLWDPVYNQSSSYNSTIKDLREDPNTTYQIDNSNYSSNWTGYNVLNETLYSKLNTTNQLIGTNWVTNNECPPGCNTCNDSKCLTCTGNYTLWTDGSCIADEYSVSKSIDLFVYSGAYSNSTMTERVDLKLAPASGVASGEEGSMIYQMTTNFFVKFDNSTFSENITLFKYGDDLQIYYNKELDALFLTTSNSSVHIAVYNNYKVLGKKWHAITLSYYYNEAINSYYPTMLNFQINNVHVKIKNSIFDGLTKINSIVIPYNVNGLFAKITTIPYYNFIGLANLAIDRINFDVADKFDDRTIYLDTFLWDNNSCVNSGFLLDNYSCYTTCAYVNQFEYDNLDESTWCDNDENSNLICSCPSENLVQNNLIMNFDNNQKCGVPDYVDFGQISSVSTTVLNASTNYTLEFWFYLFSYNHDTTTRSFSVQWLNFIQLNYKYDSKKYMATCWPLYNPDNSDNMKINYKYYFQSNPTGWVYLRCSVNTTTKRMLFATHQEYTNEFSISDTAQTPTGTTTTLTVVNNNLNAGILFIRQLKL